MSEVEVPERGICVVCGCTNENPCVLEGETCCWVDPSQTMCSFCNDTPSDDGEYDEEPISGEIPDFGPWDDEDWEDMGEDL